MLQIACLKALLDVFMSCRAPPSRNPSWSASLVEVSTAQTRWAGYSQHDHAVCLLINMCLCTLAGAGSSVLTGSPQEVEGLSDVPE